MTDLTRRSFGKMSMGALGVMAAESGVTRAAGPPAASGESEENDDGNARDDNPRTAGE
jgi:hypothetical protein